MSRGRVVPAIDGSGLLVGILLVMLLFALVANQCVCDYEVAPDGTYTLTVTVTECEDGTDPWACMVMVNGEEEYFGGTGEETWKVYVPEGCSLVVTFTEFTSCCGWQHDGEEGSEGVSWTWYEVSADHTFDAQLGPILM